MGKPDALLCIRFLGGCPGYQMLSRFRITVFIFFFFQQDKSNSNVFPKIQKYMRGVKKLKEIKSKVFSVRFTEREYLGIKQQADNNGLSVSAYVREIIKKGGNAHECSPKDEGFPKQ